MKVELKEQILKVLLMIDNQKIGPREAAEEIERLVDKEVSRCINLINQELQLSVQN